MVRSPCCEKEGLKKGPWTPEEDQKLLAYIEKHGHGSWRALPSKAGLQRCGKSCRLRWINYLRPDIKRGKFTLHEEQTIIQLHALLGNRWSAIAAHLPKRTDNEIKNYWNTHLKKRLDKMGIDPVTHKPKADAFGSSVGHSKDAANLSHMAQWESARVEAEARLVRESKVSSNPLQNQLNNLSQLFNPNPNPRARPQCLDVLKAWQGVVSGMMFSSAANSLESPTSTLSFSESVLPVPGVGFQDHDVHFGANNNNNITTSKGLLAMTKNNSTATTTHQLTTEVPAIMPQVMKQQKMDPSSSMGMQELSDNNAWFMDSFRPTPEHEMIMNDYSHDISSDQSTWFIGAGNENESTVVDIMDGLSEILTCNNVVNNDQIMQSSGSSTAVASQSGNGRCCGNVSVDQDNRNYWNSLLNMVDLASSPSFNNMEKC